MPSRVMSKANTMQRQSGVLQDQLAEKTQGGVTTGTNTASERNDLSNLEVRLQHPVLPYGTPFSSGQAVKDN